LIALGVTVQRFLELIVLKQTNSKGFWFLELANFPTTSGFVMTSGSEVLESLTSQIQTDHSLARLLHEILLLLAHIEQAVAKGGEAPGVECVKRLRLRDHFGSGGLRSSQWREPISPRQRKAPSTFSKLEARCLAFLFFLQEQGPKAPHGYIICRCAYPMQIHPQVTALPWFCL